MTPSAVIASPYLERASSSFHLITDLQNRVYHYGGVDPNVLGHAFTLLDRKVTYQFYPHFHPYVLPLIQRLNQGGIAGLQDADTLYLPQPNPSNDPLTMVPNSTRAILTAAANATRKADGAAVTLPPGTAFTLPDGISVSIPQGTAVVGLDGSTSTLAAAASVILPGALPLAFSGGSQWTIAGTPTIVPDGTAVALPSGATAAVLTRDGSAVDLPSGTAVTIRRGLPKPFYYDDQIFDGYQPSGVVVHPHPVKNLDFSSYGAYSVYNWELFFHVPLLIAVHLSQNQRFQEAQTWFHYIFDPTDNSAGPTPERFWKVLPFQSPDVRMIEDILENLATNQDPGLAQQTVDSIDAWRNNPFQPFVVGKYRPTAYMLKTVMAYLDNLIAWGDSLFRQYTIETINEATQVYLLAANLLGPKPQALPQIGSVKTRTYADLRLLFEAAASGGNLSGSDFGDPLVDLEVDIPFDTAPLPSGTPAAVGAQSLASIAQTLYFCVPRNDKLLGYWDTVADRLFKIHNSLNLQGVFQQPPLFDPPIDPALLVRAAAAGLDVSAIVSGLNQPLPLVRFDLLVAKATEIAQEVKALGGNLLAAIEKQDNEALALLRAQHESTLLGLGEMVKYAQWQDAIKARQGLEQTLANAGQRYTYYQQLLGRTASQISIPQLDGLDTGGLGTLNFTQADSSSEPGMALDAITVDIAQDATQVSDGEIKTLSRHEAEELAKLASAHGSQSTASGFDKIGGTLAAIPNFGGNIQPWGAGPTITYGGSNLAAAMTLTSSFYKSDAESDTYQANKTAKLGSYSRRELEWTFQSNLAVGEINQTLKQLRGAQIREAIAHKEYENHQTQMQHALQIVDFLQGNDIHAGFQVKETTTGFYAWMKREVKALYAKAFQLAFEVAKKAERAMQYELGDATLSYIQFTYLDGTEGLLAGEKLLFDIKAMEMAYHDLNQREYELTKHVSLQQVDPRALIQLRATGACAVTLPEELFDLDGPGHYFRRIKSVAVTIPCVVGPYTSVNCTVSLQTSSIRTSADAADGYGRKGSDDPRFNDYYGTVQSIVTSSGQSDSGLFDPNLKDERYLPFERVGLAGSQWRLTIPADVRQFDFDTITDVILHIRYTAREGGEALKAAAVKNLQSMINRAQTVGSVRLFSVRHEFPSEWARFKGVSNANATSPAALSLVLLPVHYPYWAQGLIASQPVKAEVKAVAFFAEMPPTETTSTVAVFAHADGSGGSDSMSQNPTYGSLLVGQLANVQPLPRVVTDPTQPWTLYFDNNRMSDLWLAITWGKA